MDATYRTLVSQSSISAAVLSRGSDVTLIELPDAMPEGLKLIAEGFTCQGFVGLVDGKVEIAASKPLDVECMFAMGRAVTTFTKLAGVLPQQTKGDAVSWLERLMQLPDTREKFGSA